MTPDQEHELFRRIDAACRVGDFAALQGLRTCVDEYETPREMAVNAGLSEIAEVLGASEENR